jgi:hypothetical protein
MLRPRSRMFGSLEFGDPDSAAKVDEYLVGFGEN